jgi:hypothetical protein
VRRNCLLVATLAASLVSCRFGTSSEQPADLESLTLLPSDGAYTARVGNSFFVNLVLVGPPEAGVKGPGIRRVSFEPASPAIKIRSVKVESRQSSDREVRYGMAIKVVGEEQGSHAASAVRVTTRNDSRSFPGQRLEFDIQAGVYGGLLALGSCMGVHQRPVPLVFTVENPSSDPIRLLAVRASHRLVRFRPEDFFIDRTAVPANGFTLQPHTRAAALLRWSVDVPAPPAGIEVRPVLEVETGGQRGFVGLQNMIFRGGPAREESPEPSGCQDVIERSQPPA